VVDFSHLYLFITSAVVLLLIPGPAVLFIAAHSIERGPKFGVASAGGIAVGSALHLCAIILGISAIITSSATAFTSVKYFGAFYLIGMGVYKLFEKSKSVTRRKMKSTNIKRIFLQGIFIQLLNPKVALFFISFLPQFVRPERGPVTLQIALLGSMFIGLGFLSDSMYAVLAGNFGHSLETDLKKSHMRKYFSAFIYICLGLFTALYGRR